MSSGSSPVDLPDELAGRTMVFIGGLHRSGTTLLADSLSDHPDVSGFHGTGVPRDEGQFLQSVYPIARTFGGPGRFGFHPDARLTEESHLATADSASRLWREWASFWDLDKPVLLEKSPPNLLHYRFLQKCFPGARFITIVRHPVAVSLSTRKWSKTGLDSLIEHWLICHDTWQEDRRFLKRELAVKYEHFAAAPQEVMTEVFSFVGIPTIEITRGIAPAANDKYYEEWNSIAGRWLHRRKTSRWIREYEERVSRFGYSLRHCDQILPLPNATATTCP